jgi:hypothetical protein
VNFDLKMRHRHRHCLIYYKEDMTNCIQDCLTVSEYRGLDYGCMKEEEFLESSLFIGDVFYVSRNMQYGEWRRWVLYLLVGLNLARL